MIRIRKTMVAAVMMFFVLVFATPIVSLAEGTTSIWVSSSSVSVGDTLKVEVTASASDTIRLKYNTDVLKLANCSINYTTDANTVTFEGTKAVLEFTAQSEGKSNLIVSGNAVSGSSTSIQVSGGSDAATTEDTTADSSSDTTAEVDGQFVVDGVGYVVSERFADDEIPTGFEKTRVMIDNYNYKALTNGSLTLIYLKPAADTSGKGVFYVYNAEANTVSTFDMIRGGNGYLLVSTPEKPLFEGLKETQVTIEGRQVSAYCIEGQNDFCFVYGTNQDGAAGWYQYDMQEGTLQRVNEQLVVYGGQEEDVVASASKDVYFAKWTKQRYLLATMLFIIVVLAVVVINLAIGRRHRFTEDEPEEDELEDDVLRDDELKEDSEVVDKNDEVVDKNIAVKEKDKHRKTNADNQVDILDLNDL